MYRIGFSRDIHRLEKNNRPFILGGVNIPFEKGNVSHSDGDCLYHAIAEALLGALALGDLGHFFPDNDPKYLNMDSKLILKECFEMIKKNKYQVNNLDTVIVLEKPHLQNYLSQIRSNISEILEVDISQVSVKAQSNEQCGEVGNNSAVVCFATVLLRKDD